MFFVRKENVGTLLGTQKEFAAAQRRGIEFFSATAATPGNAVWHYLWPAHLIEESVRNSIMAATPAPDSDPIVGEEPPETLSSDAPDFFIWSQEVAKGELVGEPLIKPFHSDEMGETGGWAAVATAHWAAHAAPTSGAPAN